MPAAIFAARQDTCKPANIPAGLTSHLRGGTAKTFNRLLNKSHIKTRYAGGESNTGGYPCQLKEKWPQINLHNAEDYKVLWSCRGVSLFQIDATPSYRLDLWRTYLPQIPMPRSLHSIAPIWPIPRWLTWLPGFKKSPAEQQQGCRYRNRARTFSVEF
ncbi:hypothetical protein BJY01DRAFT_24322 [Aspergillus pseudoustus]|uniref:Uncharacterized protein n=1 Tax=Aspergillus pseudoustus TaxID=1810923 RepID=A0ABR4JIS7_9EURO